MHEYSIVQALVERVEEISRGYDSPAIRGIVVKIGELSGVETELLVTAYEVFRERTCCESADLTVLPVEARWVCSACGRRLPWSGLLRCPDCGGAARLLEGDEIVLERIEMEVA